jgi:hypothetical protein
MPFPPRFPLWRAWTRGGAPRPAPPLGRVVVFLCQPIVVLTNSIVARDGAGPPNQGIVAPVELQSAL